MTIALLLDILLECELCSRPTASDGDWNSCAHTFPPGARTTIIQHMQHTIIGTLSHDGSLEHVTVAVGEKGMFLNRVQVV